jgi:hypothetical protein
VNGTFHMPACCSVWAWNLVSRIKGRTLTEGIREWGAKEHEMGRSCSALGEDEKCVYLVGRLEGNRKL